MSERNITTIHSTPRSINYLLIAVVTIVTLITTAIPEIVQAAEEYRTVSVADPYLEMRTGPGRGYPKFYVVDRGERVEIIKRRTDWFLVRSSNGKEGWVDRGQMEKTLQATGSTLSFAVATQEDFTNAKWETGILAGDFGGANIVSVYGGYSLNPNLSIEVWGSQILGNFSNGWMGSVNVVHEMWPDWRISPLFTLGTGVIRTSPKSTIVQGKDRTDQVAHVGVGVRAYITRRFLLRAEFKSYVVFTSRDENEEIEEWKAGFAFFF